jgi:hypothetical protein bthaB_30134
MEASNEYKNNIENAAKDLEESSTYSFKGHYNSSAIWIFINRGLSISAAILAAIASVSAFKESLILAGILSALTAIISSFIAILNPNDCMESHKKAADSFLALNRRIRHFIKIDLKKLDDLKAREKLEIFSNEYDLLIKQSLPICWLAYKIAKKNIDEGGNEFKTDKDNRK